MSLTGNKSYNSQNIKGNNNLSLQLDDLESNDALLQIQITNNASLIDVNINDISLNAYNIGENTSDISANYDDILTNAYNINLNTDDISTNAYNISVNTDDISLNVYNIGVNTDDISTNTYNIGVNTDDISTNTYNIGVNTSNIATNTATIADITYNSDYTMIDDLMINKNGDIGQHVSGTGNVIGLVNNSANSQVNNQHCICGRLNGNLVLMGRGNGNNEGTVFANYDDGDGTDILTGFINSQGRWVIGSDVNKYLEAYRLYIDGTTKFSDYTTFTDDKRQYNAFTMDHEIIIASMAYKIFEAGFIEYAYPNNIIINLPPVLTANTEYGSVLTSVDLGDLTNPGISVFTIPSGPNPWDILDPTPPNFNHNGGSSDPDNSIPPNPDGLPFTITNPAYNTDIVLNGVIQKTGWHDIVFSVQAEEMHWIKTLLGRIEIYDTSSTLIKTSFWGGFEADSQSDHKSYYSFEVSLTFYADIAAEYSIFFNTKYWFYTAATDSVVIGKVVVKRK